MNHDCVTDDKCLISKPQLLNCVIHLGECLVRFDVLLDLSPIVQVSNWPFSPCSMHKFIIHQSVCAMYGGSCYTCLLREIHIITLTMCTADMDFLG
jgi:hypothetical protein